METEAYISLGSNLGDRELNLLLAVSELGKIPGSRVTALSSFYETAPVGMPDDTPPFYNAAARLLTTLSSPLELLRQLQQIEKAVFGRTPSSIPASRRMDLDLLLFGDRTMQSPELTLPHAGMTQRRFVLTPLVEIAPTLVHPTSGIKLEKYLEKLSYDQQVRILE